MNICARLRSRVDEYLDVAGNRRKTKEKVKRKHAGAVRKRQKKRKSSTKGEERTSPREKKVKKRCFVNHSCSSS